MRNAGAVRRVLVVAAAVLAALYLSVGLLAFVPSSLGTAADVALTTMAVVLAWVGVAGVVRERPVLAELAALGLALLGFWQAVARAYALPAGVVMALAAAVGARATASGGADGEGHEPDGSDPDGHESDGSDPGGSEPDDHEPEGSEPRDNGEGDGG